MIGSPRMLALVALLLFGPGCAGVGRARDVAPEPRWYAGAEVQAYPTGVVTALHAQRPVSEHGAVTLRAGYNRTDRGDAGEHDEEDGGGFGGGVGYRHAFAGHAADGWVLGGRVDVWFLDVDWRDDPGPAGSTDVTVLQPTVEGGYAWVLGNGRLELLAAFGFEINVDTDGEDVGEGAIGLVGLTYAFGL